jgi:hypothetical protein
MGGQLGPLGTLHIVHAKEHAEIHHNMVETEGKIWAQYLQGPCTIRGMTSIKD